MGVHTGDSATVAPAQTLTDREYQTLRDASADVIRAVGVETGGSNVQFALNRDTGELVVIEMNPRVSRSSALASKATGYPIAKVATRLALGYTLDEIPNDITRTTPAAFEPTLDYVVVKLPRFAFEKFPGAETGLTTQMKSVGEVMGIGRTFAEAWGKAMRSRELDHDPRTSGSVAEAEWDRFDAIQGRLTAGEDPAALAAESGVHPWFVDEWELVAHAERMLRRTPVEGLVETDWRRLKALGLADARIAALAGSDEGTVRRLRWAAGVRPVYKAVDSCAAEVEAQAPYFYSTYELEDELPGARAADGDHPRRRPQPDRPGDRVRLLLRPGRAHVPRAGLRGGDDQLQPGDGVDRRRDLRPALLRAPDGGGRARGGRARAAGGGRGDVRRPDAASARAPSRGGRRADPRDAVRRDRHRRGPRPVRHDPARAGAAGPGVGDGRGSPTRPPRSPAGSATRCSSARATSSVGARCASATTRPRSCRGRSSPAR